jgi:signal transduction histidine kinase
MQTNLSGSWRQPGALASLIVLAILLAFTYSLFFLVPYQGFYFNPSNGEVLVIYQPDISNPDLRVGDFIERVGPVTFEMYQKERVPFFPRNTKPGEMVNMVVRRDGQTITIPWKMPGFNRHEFRNHFTNIWWLAYIFWFTGTCAHLFMRPKDGRWRLFLASNYLTALFIMFGAVSSFRILGSATLLRVVAWLMLPGYLHFHWIFPHSLRPVPRWLRAGFYLVCGLMAAAELFLPVPATLYFLAVILAFGGSILLLALHYAFQPEHRREVSILAVAAFFSLGFTIVASIVASSGHTPRSAIYSLLVLPILPGAYFYVLYQGRLGQLELRANRAMSLVFFLILLGTLLMLTVGYSGSIDIPSEALAFDTVLITLFTTFIGILVFPAFQSFVERRILGITLPSQSLSEDYSARIVTSDMLSDLLKLLREQVFPSLLIRQYAFVRNLKMSAQVLLSENVTQDQVRKEALVDLFASLPTGSLIPLPRPGHPLEWVQLMLPLRFGSELIGAWLLGRRDPDDRYPQAEIPILQSLANQTAIALSNIIQTERLRTMYEANINRYELERAGLARDLHDGFLNEMAGMLMKHEPASLPQEFLESFDKLILRLREIVSNLRPPMLEYGLKFAIDGLADNLSERSHDTLQISSEIQAEEDSRYPEIVENNLYRIVQEACENALKYARARFIHITGKLSAERIDIEVSDDGMGFNAEASLQSDELLANRHFGLAGMHERAALIGAEIKIDSKPRQGTRVQMRWEEE